MSDKLNDLKYKYPNLQFNEDSEGQRIQVMIEEDAVFAAPSGHLNEELVKKLSLTVQNLNELAPILNKYELFEIYLEVVGEEDLVIKVANVYTEQVYDFKTLSEGDIEKLIKEYVEELKERIVEDFNNTISQEQVEKKDDPEAQEKLEKLKVKEVKVFVQNAKMKDSSDKDLVIFNFGIPAFLSRSGMKTCPMASACVKGCYAKSGTYLWRNVQGAYERRMMLTEHSLFEEIIMFEIDKIIKRNSDKTIFFRIHDSGDFYSEKYQQMWYNVAEMYKDHENIKFYAYTKMVSQSKAMQRPENFDVIFSFGGREDNLIDPSTDRHSFVFETEEELNEMGYVNASSDDKKALTDNLAVGLVYHGNTGYDKTTWKTIKNKYWDKIKDRKR